MNYLGAFGFTLLWAVLFWPWGIGLVDLAVWMTTGAQLSSIPWESGRGAMCILWPVLGSLVVCFVASMFNI